MDSSFCDELTQKLTFEEASSPSASANPRSALTSALFVSGSPPALLDASPGAPTQKQPAQPAGVSWAARLKGAAAPASPAGPAAPSPSPATTEVRIPEAPPAPTGAAAATAPEGGRPDSLRSSNEWPSLSRSLLTAGSSPAASAWGSMAAAGARAAAASPPPPSPLGQGPAWGGGSNASAATGRYALEEDGGGADCAAEADTEDGGPCRDPALAAGDACAAGPSWLAGGYYTGEGSEAGPSDGGLLMGDWDYAEAADAAGPSTGHHAHNPPGAAAAPQSNFEAEAGPSSSSAWVTAGPWPRLGASDTAAQEEADAAAAAAMAVAAAAEETQDFVCSICLEPIEFADSATIKGCEHTYCAPCIVKWSLHRENCPQCKRPFTMLYTYRHLDGTLSDFPVEESLVLLQRARWLEGAVDHHRETARPHLMGADDAGDAAGLYDYDEDACWEDEDFYGGGPSSSSRILIQNRRFGGGGVIRSGRSYARPVAPQPATPKFVGKLGGAAAGAGKQAYMKAPPPQAAAAAPDMPVSASSSAAVPSVSESAALYGSSPSGGGSPAWASASGGRRSKRQEKRRAMDEAAGSMAALLDSR